MDTETLEESVNTVEGGLGEAPAETTAEAGTQEDPSNITQEENPNVTEDAAMEEASDTMQDGDPHTAESEADMPDEDMETPGVEDTGNSLAVEGDYLWPGEAEEYYDPESVSADRTAGAEQDIAELPLYTDYDTAVQAVRDQAAARKDRAYLKVSEDLLDQVQDGKLWDDVFAHTGNPKEGDYLLYSGAFFYTRKWKGSSPRLASETARRVNMTRSRQFTIILRVPLHTISTQRIRGLTSILRNTVPTEPSLSTTPSVRDMR